MSTLSPGSHKSWNMLLRIAPQPVWTTMSSGLTSRPCSPHCMVLSSFNLSDFRYRSWAPLLHISSTRLNDQQGCGECLAARSDGTCQAMLLCPRWECWHAVSETHLHGGPLKQPSNCGPHAGDALHLIIVERGFGQPVCAPQPLLTPRRGH